MLSRSYNCAACGTAGVSKNKGPVKSFCDECRAARERAADRDWQRALWRQRNPGCLPIGSRLACVDCGDEFLKTSGPLRRCPDCTKSYVVRWAAKKRRSDPAFDMVDRIRRAINGSLKKSQKRRRHWESLVGYSTQELMTHLERQFLPGMSWRNRAKWHIDHIRPLSSFQFETAEDQGFRDAWALTNLRPLWALANLKKRSRRTHLL